MSKKLKPVEIHIDPQKIAEIQQEQADLRKRFDAACVGKDLSDPEQGIVAIMEMFAPPKPPKVPT